MKTQQVKLSQVTVNEANPRIIKDAKYRKLIDSLLAFPEMLNIRPIVVDNTMTILGGNMRARALHDIATMGEQELTERISGIKNRTGEEKKLLADKWKAWQDNPTIEVIRADSLTDEQKKEFIIKDNSGYGEWDWDMLANDWDGELLDDWGLDVWNFKQDAGMGGNFGGVSGGGYPEGISENGLKSGIVEELEGLDITPDDLPKISGEDNVLMERIIIVYPGERADELAKLIGLESINKVVYSISELIGE